MSNKMLYAPSNQDKNAKKYKSQMNQIFINVGKLKKSKYFAAFFFYPLEVGTEVFNSEK